MKIIRISFEGFEKDKENRYILVSDIPWVLKLAKKEINKILEQELRK